MHSFRLTENISIGLPTDPVFIIAEIGQNHQGSLETAKKMIAKAKEIGGDCVKFQKSHLTTKFTKSALERGYEGPNSWGRTYGEHKEYLEFTLEEFRELQTFSKEQGILFSASAMDETSLEELASLNLPFIKIGSGDANNFPLLKKAAVLTVPLIISTGMQTMSTVDEIVGIMKKAGKSNYALLHCVSSYPTNPENCQLGIIQLLRDRFPDVVVGYSGHEEGILISHAAVLKGARILERHFTLGKQQKGSDHRCSLTPEEFGELVKIVRTRFYIAEEDESVKKALASVKCKTILPCEMSCRSKLGKSLVYADDLPTGHLLTEENIVAKVSEPFGDTAEKFYFYIGRRLVKSVCFDTNLSENDF